MRKVALIVGISIGVMLLAQTYILKNDVLSSGGTDATSSGYKLKGTISQTGADTVRGTGYKGIIGFWHPPYAPTEIIPPESPYITEGSKSSTNAVYTWLKVTQDTLGNPENLDYCVVYRDTFPSFVPEVADSIGATDPETTYTDIGVVSETQDYYYLVKAVDMMANRSGVSNMAYKFRQFLNENPSTTDKNWITIPYNSPYDSASAFINDVDRYLCQSFTKRDPVSQLYMSCYWDDLMGWVDNFPIVKGQMYEVVVGSDTAARIVGSHDPSFSVTLEENPATTDKNWISVPYNAVYDSASDVIGEIGRYLCQSLTKRDPGSQLYTSCYWDDLMGWIDNYKLARGMGYEMVVAKDTVWKPRVHNNTTFGRPIPSPEVAVVAKLGPLIIAPAWPDAELPSENSDVANPKNDVAGLSARGPKQFAGGEAHLVRGYLDKTDDVNLTMMAYMLNRPDEVLTDEAEGCGIKSSSTKVLWWCEPGNLFTPWQNGEEMIVVLEQNNTMAPADRPNLHYAVFRFRLNALENGEIIGSLELRPAPMPRTEKTGTGTAVSWDQTDDPNIIGHSVYRSDDGAEYAERMNTSILATTDYQDVPTFSDVKYGLRLVYPGGHESRAVSTNFRPAGKEAPEEELSEILPAVFAFGNAAPNPCTKSISIRYQLPTKARVRIELYDIAGRSVKTLLNGVKTPGYYLIRWDGTDERGHQVASGIYFAAMKAGSFKKTVKISLIREE